MAKPAPDSIRAPEKIVYSLANLGNIPIMTIIGSFLMIFYTDVVDLNPASVATLFLIARVMDGISDPIMGFILDHMPKGKLGHFRSTLLIGAVVCGINFILLWFGPVWIPGAKLVVVYITYLLIGITFDIMDISLNSLLPVMTDNLKERNSLSALKGGSYMIGIVLLGVIMPILVADGSLKSYYILIFGATFFIVLLSIIGVLGIHERIEKKHTDETKYTLKDLVRIMTYRPVLITFATLLLTGVGGAISGGAGTYFYKYVMGDIKIMSAISMISFVPMLPMIFLSPLLANKFGKKTIYLIGFVLGLIIAPVLRMIDVRSLPLIYISSLIGALGMGMMVPLMYGLQADNTNYVEHVSGKRAEAAVASLSSFLTKFGQGIGGAIPGYVLAWSGYVNGAAEQSTTALNGIIANVIYLPLGFSVVGIVIFGLGYNLNKVKVQEMNEHLKDRHQVLAAQD